jgi:diguanylate cyclase (GGDEF)-like protein
VWGSISIRLIRDPGGRPLHFIAQVQDITERRRNEHLLAHLADHDPLTGLFNRRGFERELASHLARVARYGATGALLMLDLDNFKGFNDTHGHNAGDKLIVKIARALKSRLRESDAVARMGGDEFAVLLPGGDDPATQNVAAALLRTVRGLTVASATGRSNCVTASIGIARFDDSARPIAEETMVQADRAMYIAKKAGGNRWSRSLTGEHGGSKPGSHAKAKPGAATKPSSKGQC